MAAQKPIRRNQLISPFGIGSMVDFPKDESLMPAGIDAWPFGLEECPVDSGWLIREERLEARLGATHFRLPPDYREPDGGEKYARKFIPFVRFPLWHYCHHCGSMEKLPPYSSTRERCRGHNLSQQSCANKPEKKRPFLIPVRFVAACQLGHIQDFPFLEWVHRANSPSATCKLRMRGGRSSAGLAGITVECSCGQKKSLGDIFQFDDTDGGPLSKLGYFCTGQQPWLGVNTAPETPCSQHLRVLQRGASNVYFPNVISSIYLPFWAEAASSEIISLLEQPNIWDTLTKNLDGNKISATTCEIISQVAMVDAKELRRIAQDRLDGRPRSSDDTLDSEEFFRHSEYEAICEGKVGPKTELYVECANLGEYGRSIDAYFSKIRLVHKLRETRVLSGFTRILPPDGSADDERIQPLKLSEEIEWLPAIKVYGEGLFIELKEERIEQWLRESPSITDRIGQLSAHYNTVRTSRGQAPRILSPKFVLLHTLSHTLINQLSFDCGYGSASLRERIYCDFSNPSKPMHGLLIYTASGDSEGTMGGLVRQGRPGRFENTLNRAIQRAIWCSSDPVCIESEGQGVDGANLAACHGCSLLPETSCEEGNRLLDRATLIGTPTFPSSGYFSGYGND